MTEIILNEGVLNDNVFYIADDGKCFKGGYTAVVEYYTFANQWHNNRNYKHFKTLANAEKFINKLNLRSN